MGLTKPVILLGIVVIGGIGMLIGRGTRGPSKAGATTTSSNGAEDPAGAGSSSAGFTAPQGPQHFDTTEVQGFGSGVALRPMDKDIFQALARPNLDRKDLLDLFPDRPYKVRVIGSVAEHRFGMVMLDLDRDGKWDERLTLKGDEVIRVVPEDDRSSGQSVQYNLAHGRWQPH